MSPSELEEWLHEVLKDPIQRENEIVKEFLCPKEDFEHGQKQKKGLAKKMTGMFNTIKDAFPTFEDDVNGKEK